MLETQPPYAYPLASTLSNAAVTMHCSSQPGRRARGGIARNTRSAGGELADCEINPFDQLMSENIQGLLLSINELATSAAAEGNEIRLVAACEVLRNSGAESFCWICFVC